MCRWVLLLGLLAPLALGGCDGAEEREAAYFARGKALYDAGELVKARLEFKNARQINPLNVEALYYLGLIAEKEKNFKAAFDAFKNVVEQEPKHIGGNIRYGRYLLLGGKLDEASARAENVLAIAPENADAHALRGAVHLQKGNLIEARRDALTARKVDPSNETALTLLVGILRKEGKNAAAIERLKEGIAADPKNISLRRVLIEIYRLDKNLDAARAAYNEIIEIEPNEQRHRIDLARMLVAGDRKSEAENVLRQSVRDFPNERAPKEVLVEFLIRWASLETAEKEIRRFSAGEPKASVFRFALARLYAKHGKLDSAEAVLTEIEAGESQLDALKAKVARARFRFRAKDFAAARELIDAVLAVDPANGDALTTHARLLLRDGKDEDAITSLRAVLRDNPKSAEAHRLLAEAHLRARNLDLAADSLRKALSFDPAHDASRLRLIRIYARQKHYDQALELLEQSIRRAPKSLALRARKVELLIAKRDFGRALETARKMQADAAEKDSALAYYTLGRANQAAGRYDQAVTSFEHVLSAKPGSRVALRGLVGSKLALKRTEEAVAYLESIREDTPDNVFALNMLGELYAFRKAYDKAEKAFLQAAAAKKGWRAPYINLGRIMLAQKKPARAVEFLHQGVDRSPNDPALRFALGTALHAARDYDGALAAFEAVLSKHPDNVLAANNIAAIIADHEYADADSLDRALRLAQAQRDSKNPYFLDTLGWLYYRKGDYNLALLYLKRAVESRPEHAYMNYHLAMAYYESGDRDAARKHLEKAVGEGASYPELDKARALLKSMM